MAAVYMEVLLDDLVRQIASTKAAARSRQHSVVRRLPAKTVQLTYKNHCRYSGRWAPALR